MAGRGHEDWISWSTGDGKRGVSDERDGAIFRQFMNRQAGDVARALRGAMQRIPPEQRGLLVPCIVDQALSEIGFYEDHGSKVVLDRSDPENASVRVTPTDKAISRGWAPPSGPSPGDGFSPDR
jgi:hypothetical protein